MQLPTNDRDRQILAEFIQTYANRQWLRGANIIDNHPTTFRKTLEVAVNYRPINEMLQLRTFVDKYGLAIEFVQVPAVSEDKVGG